ncbi:MAG: hypothetical protein WC767_02815, partial [Candidatus Paceibacterota bacterium]
MKLRNVRFGPVQGASGVQGFFGEGYPYHRAYKTLFPRGFDFTGMTFVAKTTTLHPRAGNMALGGGDRITPRSLVPDCIVARPFKGAALNAVGLSGPGARFLFETGRWQARKESFFISFMSVEKEVSARQEELREFVRMFRLRLPEFATPVGLQVNLSCPNVGLHLDKVVSEAHAALDIASVLG